MNISTKKLSFLLISAVIAFAGCSKKPVRPDPRQTMLGQGEGGSVKPEGVPSSTDASAPGLEQRSADGVIEDANTIRGLLQPVYFDFDKSAIKPSEREKLAAAAKYLKDNPDKRLLLEGHCDWRGTSEYNLGLGDRRANAAKKYLETTGTATAKLETLSKGSQGAAEKAPNDVMEKDRRVDLVILKK
ncbi:MAG TPA: OmpA family protein [Opitutaceae bacterium]|nr:OmpA family protein [Opitutaceae bacterium]